MKTWESEYYPVEAEDLAEASWRECVEHSIRKWTGLQKKNLKRHGLTQCGCYVEDNRTCLETDSPSNALCHKTMCITGKMCADWTMSVQICASCIGTEANGKPCTDAYEEFLLTGDTRPTMRWLRKAQRFVEEGNK